MSERFGDRAEAGRRLARAVVELHLADPLVLALPRGGVPVAAEVAAALHAPLDLLLVRKIGAPFQRELAVAAIADGAQPELVVDDESLLASGASMAYVEREAARELHEIARRRDVYLRGRPALPVEGRAVVVVDDGIATGTTVRAALKALRRRRPARLVLAVPVAPADAVAALRAEADELVCLATPAFFGAVGAPYADFHQVGDDEVVAALDAASARLTDSVAAT